MAERRQTRAAKHSDVLAHPACLRQQDVCRCRRRRLHVYLSPLHNLLQSCPSRLCDSLSSSWALCPCSCGFIVQEHSQSLTLQGEASGAVGFQQPLIVCVRGGGVDRSADGRSSHRCMEANVLLDTLLLSWCGGRQAGGGSSTLGRRDGDVQAK